MKIALLTTLAFCSFGAAAKDRELVGRFITIDRDVPSCGIFFVGASASFAAGDEKSEIPVVVPCVEMQRVELKSGDSELLQTHKTYRISVTATRPKNLSFPTESPDLLYLIKAEVIEEPAA